MTYITTSSFPAAVDPITFISDVKQSKLNVSLTHQDYLKKGQYTEASTYINQQTDITPITADLFNLLVNRTIALQTYLLTLDVGGSLSNNFIFDYKSEKFTGEEECHSDGLNYYADLHLYNNYEAFDFFNGNTGEKINSLSDIVLWDYSNNAHSDVIVQEVLGTRYNNVITLRVISDDSDYLQNLICSQIFTFSFYHKAKFGENYHVYNDEEPLYPADNLIWIK